MLDIPLASTSRVELEHVLVALVERSTPVALDDAASIRAELAARVWLNVNPYAVGAAP